MEFKHLKALAKADLNSPLSEVLAERAMQYQNATPEEILDLLEEVVETYTPLATTLPLHLRYAARKEIKFLVSVYEDSLKRFPYTRNRDFLSHRACEIADEILILNARLHRRIYGIAS